MIKTIRYKDIDFVKYAECLSNSSQNTDFAERKFLDIVTDKQWFLLVSGDYDAVMPVPFVRKWLIKLVIMPKLCPQLGVFSVVDNSSLNQGFYEYLTRHFLVASYTFNSGNKLVTNLSRKTSFQISRESYESVKIKYSKNRRRNIRINDKLSKNISFRSFLENTDKDFFIRNMLGNKNKLESKIYLRLCEKLSASQFGSFKILLYNGETQSIVYLFEGKARCYLSIFINERDLKNKNIPSLMIDRCIQEYIDAKDFDFVGSEIPAIAEFNQRFGAVSYQYPVIHNSKFRLLQLLWERIKNYP